MPSADKFLRIVTIGITIARGATALAQTGQSALFNVKQGRIELLELIGEVTTVIQAQINNLKLVANPSDGLADTDLCAVLDINGHAVGRVYGLDGALATALQSGTGAVVGMSRPIIVKPGSVDQNASASSTGAIKWRMRYVPVDPGAFVAAA